MAAEKNAILIVPNKNDIIHINEGFMQTKLIYENFEIHQSFTGLHQSYNASVVIEAMKAMRKYGFNITDDNIVNGIENTKFPARIEVISQDPLIILDGGHNTDGVSALTAVPVSYTQLLYCNRGILHGHGCNYYFRYYP